LTQEQRDELARTWRELRRLGLLRSAAERSASKAVKR
jgi:hypothetical protein